MRTRTLLSKENSSNPRRKLKKSDRKACPQPKKRVENKKPRLSLQQNRFTNILELSSLSASLMQLHDLFGTLVLDFSQDPVQVKISDITGNYELNVPEESLREFKLKVLLGQKSKGKPTFTIFLGECQCYPELPEGAIKVNENQNEDTVSQIDSIDGECGNKAKIDIAVSSDELERDEIKGSAPSEKNERKREFFDSDDMVSPLLNLFEGSEMATAVTDIPRGDIVTYETHHISVTESQKLEPLTNSDELIVKMRPKQAFSRLRKIRSFKKKPESNATTARRATKKRSTYRNNLEGFFKFLMTDKVCGSLLDKMKTPGNVAHPAKRISEQKIVNYSDGQKYCISFSKAEDAGEIGNLKGSARSNRPSSSRETDKSNTNNDGGIQVLFERPNPFEKAAFVEQVKKELEEWQARGEQTVNVEIVEDAKCSSSTEDSDSNVVTVYEDPKTSKKMDSEFDDTISNCCTDAIAESPEDVVLDLKENEKPAVTEEKCDVVSDEKRDSDLFERIKSDLTFHEGQIEEYVAPIPLETTSTADIEAMWMSFVEMFHQSSELAKKLSVTSQEIVCRASLPEPKIEVNVQCRENSKRRSSESAYPGQHCLPYFVEESLRRVNSMSGTWRTQNLFPTVIRKPQDTSFSPDMSNSNRFKGDLTPVKQFLFPKYDAPTSSSFHHHPALPEKFSTKKSRIFFNPHVTIVSCMSAPVAMPLTRDGCGWRDFPAFLGASKQEPSSLDATIMSTSGELMASAESASKISHSSFSGKGVTYNKCTKMKKKKRFERPRYRLPFIDEIRAQISNHKIHANWSDDKNNSKIGSSRFTSEGKREDKSLFTDAVSETGIGDAKKPGEESSSTLDDPFYDAPEIMETATTVMQGNVRSQINVRLKLEGAYLHVTVDDLNGTNFVKILREDLENSGADWTITSGHCGILTMNFNLMAESDDAPRKIDYGVQTAVVLGAEEISETEEISILTSRANKIMDTISEEDQDPPTEAYMVSEISEDCLQTFDSAREMKSSEKGSLENVNDLVEENQAKTKPLTNSTVSSIPMDTFTCERGPSDVSPSILDGRVVLNTFSDGPPTVPLIKSKSDSLLLSRRIPKKKFDHVKRKDSIHPEVYSSMYDNKSEYGEWECSIEETHHLGFRSSDWIDEKSYLEYENEELTEHDVPRRFQEEAQERPMTSAADAVKSMHQALKPINDQINDIRTKMIGMNIQPRASSRPSRSLVPNLHQPESSFSIHSRINRWLVTDPVEFSSSMTTSDGSVRGYEYMDDIPATSVSQKTRFGKLVIFPGDLRTFENNYTRNANIDDLSWTRSSIVTEPEDIMSERGLSRTRKNN